MASRCPMRQCCGWAGYEGLSLRKIVEGTWRWPRDRFSTVVLGTTSPLAPGLTGGLSFGTRIAIAAASIAVATGIGIWAGSALFYLPALMVAAVCGPACALAAFAVSLALIDLLFPGAPLLLLGSVAAIQAAMGLILREFFRESRRWGVRYRSLIGAISSAVTVSDPVGRITRPHPELGRLIGLDWPLYRGTKWREAIHPDDWSKLPNNPRETVGAYRSEIRLRVPGSQDWRWYLLCAVPLSGRDGRVAEWVSILSDTHDRKLAQEQRDIVLGELRHRLKNLMAVISSLATSSKPRDEPAVDAFLKKFLGRLHALSAAGEMMLATDRVAIEAGAVVRATLAPFMADNAARFRIEGPPLFLSEETGGTLALGVHELATNAIKYGALSVPEGEVALIWRIEAAAEGELVTIEWTERGGPPAAIPNREGFGTRVVKFVPAREKSGNTVIEYKPEGLICRITFLYARPADLPAEAV